MEEEVSREQTILEIESVLDMLRPYIHRDGGDIEFLELEEGIVRVRLLGACVGCGLSDVTMTQGVEAALIEEVPGIIGVELVKDN